MSKRSSGGGMMRCGEEKEIVSSSGKAVEHQKTWSTTEKTKRMLRKQRQLLRMQGVRNCTPTSRVEKYKI